VVALYVQDTYHMTSRLVVNAGLRWEPFLPEFDHYDRGSTFSRPSFDAGQISRIYVNAPAGSLFAGDPGVTHAFTDRRLANFSPRPKSGSYSSGLPLYRNEESKEETLPNSNHADTD